MISWALSSSLCRLTLPTISYLLVSSAYCYLVPLIHLPQLVVWANMIVYGDIRVEFCQHLHFYRTTAQVNFLSKSIANQNNRFDIVPLHVVFTGVNH